MNLPLMTAIESPLDMSIFLAPAGSSQDGVSDLSSVRHRTMSGVDFDSSRLMSAKRGRSAGLPSQQRCNRLQTEAGAASGSLKRSPFLSIC